MGKRKNYRFAQAYREFNIGSLSLAEEIWIKRILQNSYQPIDFEEQELDAQRSLDYLLSTSKELLPYHRGQIITMLKQLGN